MAHFSRKTGEKPRICEGIWIGGEGRNRTRFVCTFRSIMEAGRLLIRQESIAIQTGLHKPRSPIPAFPPDCQFFFAPPLCLARLISGRLADPMQTKLRAIKDRGDFHAIRK